MKVNHRLIILFRDYGQIVPLSLFYRIFFNNINMNCLLAGRINRICFILFLYFTNNQFFYNFAFCICTLEVYFTTDITALIYLEKNNTRYRYLKLIITDCSVFSKNGCL